MLKIAVVTAMVGTLVVACGRVDCREDLVEGCTAVEGFSRDISTQDMATISWPTTQALPRFARPRYLDVVDLADLSGSRQMLFSTLQGVINRERPRIYLVQDPSERNRRASWLRQLDVPNRVHADPWALFNKFADEVRGTVVYDPAIPDTINTATTIAGLRDGVVATPRLARKLERRYHLRVLNDLRDRFTDRMDAYSWQFEHLWQRRPTECLSASRLGEELPVLSPSASSETTRSPTEPWSCGWTLRFRPSEPCSLRPSPTCHRSPPMSAGYHRM